MRAKNKRQNILRKLETILAAAISAAAVQHSVQQTASYADASWYPPPHQVQKQYAENCPWRKSTDELKLIRSEGKKEKRKS
jgi:hypothetical protein